jgi:hypothetical protein
MITMHFAAANTGAQLKQKGDQQSWRYNTLNEEEGMLSNFCNHIFVLQKQLGCILTLKTQGRI